MLALVAMKIATSVMGDRSAVDNPTDATLRDRLLARAAERHARSVPAGCACVDCAIMREAADKIERLRGDRRLGNLVGALRAELAKAPASYADLAGILNRIIDRESA